MAETVGAILIRGDRILLGLRAPHKSFAGQWDVIGGHVEPGEDRWSALRRELVEELGIEATGGSQIDTLTLVTPGGSSVVHIYVVQSFVGEPVVRNDEHVAVEWFDLAAAKRLPNLVTTQYRRLFALGAITNR